MTETILTLENEVPPPPPPPPPLPPRRNVGNTVRGIGILLAVTGLLALGLFLRGSLFLFLLGLFLLGRFFHTGLLIADAGLKSPARLLWLLLLVLAAPAAKR
jgi:hypothetical protein